MITNTITAMAHVGPIFVTFWLVHELVGSRHRYQRADALFEGTLLYFLVGIVGAVAEFAYPIAGLPSLWWFVSYHALFVFASATAFGVIESRTARGVPPGKLYRIDENEDGAPIAIDVSGLPVDAVVRRIVAPALAIIAIVAVIAAVILSTPEAPTCAKAHGGGEPTAPPSPQSHAPLCA